jgi:RNA-directed DNA polymerase
MPTGGVATDQAKRQSSGDNWMTVEEFVQREDGILALIHDKLKSGSYHFKPAKRIEIPKEEPPKTRKLRSTIVMDRIIVVSMYHMLEKLFDGEFTESKFGFRRGRSQPLAIWHLQRLVIEGRQWVSDRPESVL